MLETLYDPDNANERCGLILKDGSLVEIENIAEDPTNGYDMKPDAILPYLKDDVVAETWHTHPQGDPNLSGDDYTGFLSYPHLTHSIIGVRNGAVAVTRWRVENGLVVACD